MESWEDAKENVQPLARGRKVEDLLGPVPEAKESGDEIGRRLAWYEGEIQRKGKASLLETEAEADPLACWIGYIRWIQEKANIASGATGDQMLALLERCCSEFVHVERYRNDRRYIRIWVRYADFASNPLEVLRYMETQKIGQSLALYYEARAVIHEQRREYAEAGATYEIGIRNTAHPVERLITRHEEFKARMLAREARKERRETANLERRQRREHRERAPLGSVNSGQPSVRAQPPIPPQQAHAPRIPSRERGSSFQIFSDAPRPSPESLCEVNETNDSMNFPRLVDEVKENRGKPTTWSEAAGVVNARHAAHGGLSFELHRDGDGPSLPHGIQKESTQHADSNGGLGSFPCGPGSTSPSRETRKRSSTEDRSYPNPTCLVRKLAFGDDASCGLIQALNCRSPTMTINTRNAIEEFEGIVNAPLPFEQCDETTIVVPIESDPKPFTIYTETEHDSFENANSRITPGRGVNTYVEPTVGQATKANTNDSGRNVVDPFEESVRLDVETFLMEWYSENKAFHMISQDLELRKGAIIKLGSNEDEAVELCVQAVLGKGRYAVVYLVETISSGDLSFTATDDVDEDDVMELALKIQRPSCPMEFYICSELSRRLPREIAASIVSVKAMFESDTSSYMLMSASHKGTLQDLLNLYRTSGRGTTEGAMDETLVIFFTIELLRIVEHIHRAGFIHTDIKPDNLLVRMKSGDAPVGPWQPNREGGWKHMGLTLIDFGRALDVSLYRKIGATVFRGDHGAESFGCYEMTHGLPWTFQADTYAIAASVHLLLTGKDMEIENESVGSRLLPSIHYKRYWNKDLWASFFDATMNLGTTDAARSADVLGDLRLRFEEFLATDAKRARALKGLIVRMGIMFHEAHGSDTTTL